MRMTEMQAVIGILQLNKLDQMIKRRNFYPIKFGIQPQNIVAFVIIKYQKI